MSGHSHWSTIKRQKESQDQKRGQIFAKIAREIQVAARDGVDPNFNPKLRLSLDKAKKASLPQENIKRAIEKGSGKGKGSALEEVILEGYGPSGVAIMLKALTDNKKRTLSEIRHIFNEHGGSLGEQGSAAYIFKDDPEKPTFTIPITNEKDAKKVLELVETLDEQEEIVDIYSNFDIPDEFV